MKGQGHGYIKILKWLIILETVNILYTHIHYNIVRIDARYTLANFRGHGVKGEGHGYINIPKWLIILETVDILYTHIH